MWHTFNFGCIVTPISLSDTLTHSFILVYSIEYLYKLTTLKNSGYNLSFIVFCRLYL